MLVSNFSQGSEIQTPAGPVGYYVREVGGCVPGPAAIPGAASCGDGYRLLLSTQWVSIPICVMNGSTESPTEQPSLTLIS